ncbi:Lipoprotein NlpI homolog precursor [Aggregatibacter aphrophilus]|uniref:Lipoprotein NlpI homolog n=1 Tax=Aggregatibacter aphrophilus TaxID=732 RepID=A0A336N383_AGGAP|nr:Lipoprotein NlpI homolog precursor [Aggregatibacter aphrophilus]
MLCAVTFIFQQAILCFKAYKEMMQRNGLFNFAVFLTILFSVFVLSGCVSLSDAFVSKNKVVLAEQNPSQHFEQEVMIVRISQVLLVGKMSNEERASLHFERGVLYDSLGLWALARYDFTQALALQPKMAAVYNYLGLYLLLDEDYDGALEAFNTVFSLDPDYEYTFLNRALNFYYVERYNLAEQDFLAFYQRNKSDPYRVLWLYLNELKFKPAEAQKIWLNVQLGFLMIIGVPILSSIIWASYQYKNCKIKHNILRRRLLRNMRKFLLKPTSI